MTALTNGTPIAEFQPQNNKQAYLAYLCGADIALPSPRNAEEALLYNLCLKGGVGGGSQYLHLITVGTKNFDETTLVLLNDSEKPLTGRYKNGTDAFNGAILIIRGADIGYYEDIQRTVVGYDFDSDFGKIVLDEDLPFPSVTGEDNVVDVLNGQFDDIVVLL